MRSCFWKLFVGCVLLCVGSSCGLFADAFSQSMRSRCESCPTCSCEKSFDDPSNCGDCGSCGWCSGENRGCQRTAPNANPFYKSCYEATDCQLARRCGFKGTWFPEDPPLFRPFAADPRQNSFSIGWRFDDQVLSNNVADVSYGNNFAIYRWFDVGPWGGELQMEIEGILWAVFAPLKSSAPLLNADYYGGFTFTYAVPCWSFRLREYHISSHIGDEFLIDHPDFCRVNPSAEYVDFAVSYDFTDEIRLYGEVGYVMHDDKSFRIGRLYGEAGLELRLAKWGYLDCYNQFYAVPIYAMHFRFRKEFDNHIDATYIFGYEVGKLCGLERRARIYLEYHDGYSLEGQFAKMPTSYLSIRASYGF